MNKLLEKINNAIVTIFGALLALLLVTVVLGFHFYDFRNQSRIRTAELESKLLALEEGQRAVNGHVTKEISRTQGELWILERKINGKGGDTCERGEKADILRPTDQGQRRTPVGNRGYKPAAQI